MPTPTYTLIEEQVLGSAVASVTLGNGGTIPQTYRDLVIEFVGTASGNANLCLRFNGDSANNYSDTTVSGNGTNPAVSGRDATADRVYVTAQAFVSTGISTIFANVMSYTSTSVHKTILGRASNAAIAVDASAGNWHPSSIAAVTSVVVLLSNANTFSVGSTFRLWGV